PRFHACLPLIVRGVILHTLAVTRFTLTKKRDMASSLKIPGVHWPGPLTILQLTAIRASVYTFQKMPLHLSPFLALVVVSQALVATKTSGFEPLPRGCQNPLRVKSSDEKLSGLAFPSQCVTGVVCCGSSLYITKRSGTSLGDPDEL